MPGPVSIWERSHSFHQADNSKLYTSSIGSFPIVTKEKYLTSPKGERTVYMFIRHPVTIGLGYIFMFLYGMCIRSLVNNTGKHWDSIVALVVHFAIGVGIYLLAAGAAGGSLISALINGAGVALPLEVQLIMMSDKLIIIPTAQWAGTAVLFITLAVTLISLITWFIAARLKPVTAMSHVGLNFWPMGWLAAFGVLAASGPSAPHVGTWRYELEATVTTTMRTETKKAAFEGELAASSVSDLVVWRLAGCNIPLAVKGQVAEQSAPGPLCAVNPGAKMPMLDAVGVTPKANDQVEVKSARFEVLCGA